MEEYEIPKGSKLYFGDSAKLKRSIENNASVLLEKNGFKEIITPYFLNTNIATDKQNTIQTSTENNKFLSLRPDSTIEVLRLALNRIDNKIKKWFYIQPIFSYPSNEEYQIGIEYIDFNDISYVLDILASLLEPYQIKYTLQISNINIVNLLIKKYKIKKEFLSPLNLESLLNSKINWISKLAHIQKIEDLQELDIYPQDIKDELIILKQSISNMPKHDNIKEHIVIEPLYFDELKYYESVYFRAFSGNTLLAKGGIYKDSGVISSGFAIYTDHLLNKILQKG
ncbi:ATP phosphoribosyltransferase regulatory subunit, divergent variant [hydrothermal vent metagenome]|uniref:ATP phosphoribosyltransferase regulatory subunit, divergent variant n=1 Tax=hydrothermal vent metagenome TaxID=652676 RepID=A0A3B1DR53_9ZZZZ